MTVFVRITDARAATAVPLFGYDDCQRGQCGARAIRAAYEAASGRARSVTTGPERGPT
jgi:hypothetical protein